LLEKIRKISESLGATLYNIDSDPDKRHDKLREVNARIEEVSQISLETETTRRNDLMKIAESISAWWGCVRQEKLIYHAMNNFQYDQGRSTLIAEGWVPTRDLPRVQLALRSAADSHGSSMPAIMHELTGSTKEPPTYFRTNKFTEAFQAIIDAYGVATYQEINPGLFTVITFPFLFAVMFGDIGHGFLMALTAGMLILFEKRIGKGFGSEILDTFYFGRVSSLSSVRPIFC
jgi:V-type H+-transporting ATPase subunit a